MNPLGATNPHKGSVDWGNKIRDALFGTMYALGHKPDGSRRANSTLQGGSLFLLLRTLQLLAFPLSTTFAFGWNRTWTSWFRDVCAVARLDPLIIGDSIDDTATYAAIAPVVVLVFAWLTLLVVARVFLFDEERGHFESSMWISALRVWSAIMTKWLFIPLLSVLLRANRCTSASSIECWSVDHTIRAVLADVTALVLATLSFAFWAMLPSRMPPRLNKDTHQFEVTSDAVVHTHMQQAELASMVLFVLIFSLSSSNSSTTLWGLSASSMVISSAMAFAPYYYLPFYDLSMSIMHGCANGLVAWASLCLLVVQLTDDTQQTVGSAMLFGCAPMVVVACFYFFNERRQTVLDKMHSELSSAQEVELWLRFSLQQRMDQWNARASMETETSHGTTKASSLTREAKASFTELGDSLRVAARPFSTSPLLQVVKCEFMLNVLDEPRKASRLLAHVRTRHMPLGWTYAVFVLRRQEQDSLRHLADGELVHSYMRFVEFYEAALADSKAAYRAVYDLWSELQQAEVDLQRVDELGAGFNANVGSAYRAFQEALALNRDSAKVVSAYSQFVKQLLNDDEQGSNLGQRAAELTRKTKDRPGGDRSQQGNPVERIFDDATGVLTISAEVDSLGEILAANDAICDLVGRSRAQLVGNHVSSLMPQPFSNAHSAILSELLAPTSGESLLDRTIPVHVLHFNGYLVPTDLTIKHVSGGLTTSAFMGVLTATHESKRNHVCLVDVASRKVLRATSSCAQMLGISVNEIIDGTDALITRFIPDFDEDGIRGSGGRSSSDESESESEAEAETVGLASKSRRRKTAALNEYHSREGKEFVLRNSVSEYVLQVRAERVSYSGLAVDVVHLVEKSHTIVDPRGDKIDMSPMAADGAAHLDLDGADSDDGCGLAMNQPLGIRQRRTRDSPGAADDMLLAMPAPAPMVFGNSSGNDAADSDDTDSDTTDVPTPSAGRVMIQINDNEDAQSHFGRMSATSGRSGMSAVAFRNSMAHIRDVFLNRSNKMDRSILMFRGAFLLTVIILIALTVVGWTITTSSFDDFRSQFIDIQQAGQRRIGILVVESQANTFNLIRMGIFPSVMVAETRATMGEFLDIIVDATTELYLNNDRLSAEHEKLYDFPGIALETVEGPVIAEHKVGLAQGLTLFVSNAQFLKNSADPVAIANLNDPHMFFVHNNGVDRLMSPVNDSTLLYEKAALASSGDVEDLQEVLLGVSLAVVVIMMVCVFVPTITRVERTRREIFDMFLHVKLTDAELLQREARTALENAGEQDLGDYAVVDDADGEADGDQVVEESANVGQRLPAKSKKRKRHLKRAFVNEGERTRQLLARVAVLILGAAFFFIFMFVMDRDTLTTSTRRLPELNWSNERSLNLVRALIDTQNLILFPLRAIDPNNPRPKSYELLLARARKAIIDTRVLNQALLFGNDGLRLYEPSLQRYGPRDELMYGDACRVMETEEGSDYDSCAAFDGGVATLGMDNMLEDFLNNAATVVSEVEALHDEGNFTVGAIGGLLTHPSFAKLGAYFGADLRQIVPRAEKQYEEEQFADIQDFEDKREIAVYVFLAVCAAMYVVIYDPMIRRLDRDLKRTRGSLLMIPVHVMNKTPALRKTLASATWL